MSTERFDRQIRLIGADGQAKIEKTSVGIVGLGGLGSHVAQQLAYLGFKSYRLLDGDRATESSLNRLIGAVPEDAKKSLYKVDIAERVIHAIEPNARIDTFSDFFVTENGFGHIRAVDVVIGAMDNDASRLILNELCQAYNIPYLDLATDIDADAGVIGGRLVFSVDGRGCLSCAGELDQDALNALFSTDGQLKEEREIYGVPQSVLGTRGPAVVSVNGLIGSLGVTELFMHVTGYSPVQTYLTYVARGPYPGIRIGADESDRDCYYCQVLRGQEATADVEHYIRDGWGPKLTERLGGGEEDRPAEVTR
ncbi:MAG: ThiF family adenylyltransferase [Opitutales bacterium]